MLPVFDLSDAQGKAGYLDRLAALKATASTASDAAKAVAQILADVREHGDDAVVRYMRQWTDPDFTVDQIRVSEAELDAADAKLTGQLRDAIATAIDQVRAYQQHILPADVKPVTIGGAELGMRFTPVDSAGLCVPGGTAVLFSTIIMLAVPAQVAGVDPKRISVINPPPTRKAGEPTGGISPIVLATCRMLGIENVYRIGGAQGVAALAMGTQSVKPVDMIAGPGNIFVQLAKAQVAGLTGTDGGFYGPSEIVTIADETADPRRVAADLIAQAEHDPGKCFLVAWKRSVIEGIVAQVKTQMKSRRRLAAIEAALDTESAAILARSEDEAIEVANAIACEHLNLAVAEPDAMVQKIRHAGEIFLGDTTPVAAGDYYAGPSHCLPTGTTARFTSGISVYTFLKRTGTVGYPQGMSPKAIADIACMAEAEGLDAHAESARVRS